MTNNIYITHLEIYIIYVSITRIITVFRNLKLAKRVFLRHNLPRG